jgi:preprotein translocase subunit SecF
MEPELKTQLAEIEKKLDTILDTAEKTRRYTLIRTGVTIILIVFPIVMLLFFLPQIMGNLESQITELGLTT